MLAFEISLRYIDGKMGERERNGKKTEERTREDTKWKNMEHGECYKRDSEMLKSSSTKAQLSA